VFHDNALVWLSADGEVRETLSLFDAVTTGPPDFGFLPRDELLEMPFHVGLFHANSAYAMDQPHLVGTHPLFSKQNVLVTSRNQNRIFVVDRRNRSLVWEWGRGVLQAPHGATWLGNGHILVFDNGTERKTSRILEVDPTNGRVVWEYPNAQGVEFHSETRGLAQRLANDNTLITNSQGGQAFEVTPAGTTVWQYFAPVLAQGARRPVLMSLRRYPESWVEPLRDRAHGIDGSVVP
jgi:outer membrane protein assembly factor BamB